MRTAVKICGLKDEAAVRAVINAKADYAGFVFFPESPRHVSFARAAELMALLPTSVASVMVVVDPDDATIQNIREIAHPNYIQLHGKETPDRAREIKKLAPDIKIIKAIAIRSSDDIARAKAYEIVADMLLFDAKPPESAALPGGNGLAFDWVLLAKREFSLPWFLSGGLGVENVAEAIRITAAKMVDVSSGVESAPGVKDIARIQEFVEAARHEKYPS